MLEQQFTPTHLGLITTTKQNLLDLQFDSLVGYVKQLDAKFDEIYSQLNNNQE